MRWGWERLAALAGIVAVVLWVIAIAIDESTSGPEDDDAAGLLARFQDEEQAILAAGWLLQLGALFFLVLVAVLLSRVLVFPADGPMRVLTAIAFAGGIGIVLFLLALPGPDMSGALNNEELSPEAALTLTNIEDIFFLGAELSAVPFLAGIGLLALRLRFLPVWYGWLSLLVALLLLILPIGWAALLFAFPLWVLLTSVLLYLRPSTMPSSRPAASS